MRKGKTTAAIITLFIVLGGCRTFRYLPAHEAPNVSPETIPVSFSKGNIQIEESSFGGFVDSGEVLQYANAAVNQELGKIISYGPTPSHPVVNAEFKVGKGPLHPSFIVGLLTLQVLPYGMNDYIDGSMVVTRKNRIIFSTSTTEKMTSYISGFTPLPLIFSTHDEKEFKKLYTNAMRTQLNALAQRAKADQNALENDFINQNEQAQRQWLASHNKNLLWHVAMTRFMDHAPSDNLISWHLENQKAIPDYQSRIPESLKVWFKGPRGNTPADLRAKLKAGQSADVITARVASDGGPYPGFSDSEIATLREGGLPEELIVAMIKADGPSWSGGGDTGPSAEQVRSKRPDLADLVLDNTRGKYMNPWTSDGVLADWVDKAVNAEMGSAAGSAGGAAAGAYAAKQLGGGLLGQAVGGALGSKAGQAAGREAAIDEAYIRKTSDQSFRTLEHMARYLEATYSGTRHYQDAIKAANEIYPGLVKEIRQQ